MAQAPVSDLYSQDDDELLKKAGLNELYYSTMEAADLFFDKTDQWMYWGLRDNIFVYENGKKIQPINIGSGSRRRYTLDLIKEIALATYRRGNITKARLAAIIRRTIVAENGGTEEQIKAIPLPDPPSEDREVSKSSSSPKFELNFERVEPGRYFCQRDNLRYQIFKDPERDWIWRLTFQDEDDNQSGEFMYLGGKNGFTSARLANSFADEHYKSLSAQEDNTNPGE